MLTAYFHLRLAERIVPGMPCLVPVLIVDVVLLILFLRSRRHAD